MNKLYIKKKFINIVSNFSINKNIRKDIRSKYLHTMPKCTYLKNKNELEKAFKIIEINKNGTEKILHLSTYKEKCGIATFLDDYINGINNNSVYSNSVIPVNFKALKDINLFFFYLDKIIAQAENFDIISIQHEYAFWTCENTYWKHRTLKRKHCYGYQYNYNHITSSLVFLDYFIEKLIKKNKKIKIVWHSDFNLVIQPFLNDNPEIKITQAPFFRLLKEKSIQLVTMNKKMQDCLERYDLKYKNCMYLPHPIPTQNYIVDELKIKKLKNELGYKKNDIILGSFGFITPDKGILTTLKILKHFPNNFKYLIVGGKHPKDESKFIDKLQKYIRQNKLDNRVIITGFLPMEEIPTYIKSVDIALYLCSSKLNYASGAINQLIYAEIPILTGSMSYFKNLEEDWGCIKTVQNTKEIQESVQTIQKLLQNKNEIIRLKNNCKNFIEENTFEKFTAKIFK